MDQDRAAAGSVLLRMTEVTPTDWWNDSCARDELAWAIERGATGATSNPSIVLEVMRKEADRWEPHVRELHADHPTWTEDMLTWALIEEMAAGAAGLLAPAFARSAGRQGRLSIQTDPRLYVDAERIVEQAVRFAALAPNMQVKIPVTAAGIAAIEEATFRGVNVNATVSFTVPQALAVAEAVERGLRRREAAGFEIGSMTPVCTLMFGRLDDWLRIVVERDGLPVDPQALDLAGIAVFKRTCALYRERGYRTRLLGGAYRTLLHWTELVGADAILTITHAWQVRIEESGLDPVERIDVPVDPAALAALEGIEDFRRAYAPDGMSIAEFDGFGSTVRTLRQFIASYHDLVGTVRGIVLPDPEVRS
jgi:transaldolase